MAAKKAQTSKSKGEAKGGGKAYEIATSHKRPEGYTPRYKHLYEEQIRPALIEELQLENVMQAPRLEKIVLNMGVGEGARDEKVIQVAENDLALIAGQRPRRTRAKLSVAAFKLRKGMPVGCCVTLRGIRMYEFLERLIQVAIPRVRDFRGLSPRGFDGRGNYNFGVREHRIFTEVDTSDRTHVFGMDIALVTTSSDTNGSRRLLDHFGMPFREG